MRRSILFLAWVCLIPTAGCYDDYARHDVRKPDMGLQYPDTDHTPSTAPSATPSPSDPAPANVPPADTAPSTDRGGVDVDVDRDAATGRPDIDIHVDTPAPRDRSNAPDEVTPK